MFSGWEVVFGLGALALVLALAYAAFRNRKTGTREQRLAEAGARRIYDDPRETDAAPVGRRRRVPPLALLFAAGLAVALMFVLAQGGGWLKGDGGSQAGREAYVEQPARP